MAKKPIQSALKKPEKLGARGGQKLPEAKLIKAAMSMGKGGQRERLTQPAIPKVKKPKSEMEY